MGVKVREKDKGSGEWWIFINHQGKRKAKKVGRSKKAAENVAKQIEAKLTLGDAGLLDKEKDEEESVPSFSDYAGIWIKTIIPATCKPSTVIGYQILLDNHVLPVFGKKPVADISRMMVKTFLMKKVDSGLAISTVSYMKSCISGVLNAAIDDEVLTVNPAQRLGKLFKKRNTKDEIKPYTKEELSILLKAFQDFYPRHYPMVLTLARTGMRIGEVTALKWKDIDFDNRLIHVQRTFSRDQLMETPKNGKDRLVDMSKQLSTVLYDLKMDSEASEAKGVNGSEWIFKNQVGSAIDIRNWRKRIFYKTIAKAGLDKIRIHDLRHTYASLLIEAGESLAYIRDQLGHHSISFTVDIYGHLTPGGNKDAVDRLDDGEY